MPKPPLRIAAWDDPRCLRPLRMADEAWQRNGGSPLCIRRRPLTAFNDQPVAELAATHDLMIVDYPHMLQAAAARAIIPVHDLVDAGQLSRFEARALGAAQRSFAPDGLALGLACDAACHLSAWRPSRDGDRDGEPPMDWEGVLALQERRPGSVALALWPTDAISCLLSLLAAGGAGPTVEGPFTTDRGAAREALSLLARLAAGAPDCCWDSTPPDLFRHALPHPEITCIPLTFGYPDRAAADQGGWRFGAPPQPCGSLLGGAGLAVSAAAADAAAAAAFASWYCSEAVQRRVARTGGIPVDRAAWRDEEANRASCGFFERCRGIQAEAWVRPLAAWWPGAQRQLGECLAAGLRARRTGGSLLAELEGIFLRCRAEDAGEAA